MSESVLFTSFNNLKPWFKTLKSKHLFITLWTGSICTCIQFSLIKHKNISNFDELGLVYYMSTLITNARTAAFEVNTGEANGQGIIINPATTFPTTPSSSPTPLSYLLFCCEKICVCVTMLLYCIIAFDISFYKITPLRIFQWKERWSICLCCFILLY